LIFGVFHSLLTSKKNGIQEVSGSIPLISTKRKKIRQGLLSFLYINLEALTVLLVSDVEVDLQFVVPSHPHGFYEL
jgi:hypothetical protein